jgi:hypothetical protein
MIYVTEAEKTALVWVINVLKTISDNTEENKASRYGGSQKPDISNDLILPVFIFRIFRMEKGNSRMLEKNTRKAAT